MKKFDTLNHNLVKPLMIPNSIRPIKAIDLASKCEHRILKGPYIENQLDYDITTWDCFHAIILEGRPGCGKTTTLCNKVVRPAVKHGKKVLIIVNRSPLMIPYKRFCAKMIGKLDNYTDKGLMEEENFGNLFVVTYQGLEAFIHRHKDLTFDIVIADEMHYFIQDSSFSDCTGHMLYLIPKVFHNAIRIYASATSVEVLPFILKAELYDFEFDAAGRMYTKNLLLANAPLVDPLLPKIYKVDSNFDRINLKFFDNEVCLLEHFSMTPSKAMIFSDSVQQCESIAAYLNDSLVMTSKKFHSEPEKYKKLIEAETFDEKYFISTSVFSNGNNINDKSVKDVAVFLINQTEIMQMAGRRRIKYNDPLDTFTLYLYIPSLDVLTSKMNQIQRLQVEISKCKKDYFYLMKLIKDSDDDIAARIRQIFRVNSKGNYEINPLAEDKLYMDYKYYEYLFALIKDYGNEAYCQFIAALFGKTYDESMNFCTVEDRRQILLNETKSYRFPMDKESFEEFSESITKRRIQLMGKLKSDNTGDNRKPLKEKALNNRFEELKIPVRIVKENDLYYLENI